MIEVFHIVPASGRALGIFAVILAFLLGMAALFGYFTHASRSARFELSGEGLHIRSALYGRMIPARALVAEEARLVDLDVEHELQPTRRTNGIGMPGYRAGWFNTRRRGRALLFVTDPRSVVYLPTRDGYGLLLSVRRPQEFIRTLQRIHEPGGST